MAREPNPSPDGHSPIGRSTHIILSTAKRSRRRNHLHLLRLVTTNCLATRDERFGILNNRRMIPRLKFQSPSVAPS
jgi:hypothetical protein